MTRNDRDGDNAALTPSDTLGDVHAEVPLDEAKARADSASEADRGYPSHR